MVKVRHAIGWGAWRRPLWYLGQVTIVRNDHSGLPLDGLHHEGHNVGVARQALLEGLDIVVRDLWGAKRMTTSKRPVM